MWPFRTPDNRRRKKSPRKRGVDPRGSLGGISQGSSESPSTNEESSNNNGSSSSHSNSNTMRSSRGLPPQHQNRREYRGAATSSNSATSNSNEEDKMRLRSFLRGAMSQRVVATPDEEQRSQMMKKVLARTKTMDHRKPTNPEQSTAAAETISQAGASSVASSLSHHSRSTLTLSTHQEEGQYASARAEEQNKTFARRLERVDANPVATDFRNRLRTVTKTSPIRPVSQSQQQSTTSMLDSKTREMIQDRFRKRLQPVAPSKIDRESHVNQIEDETKFDNDDPDLEGYDTFFQTLQQEVHGQHSLLWHSFSAVMQHERPPELETVPQVGKNQFRFDKRTKEMLTMMNAYTQEKPYVVHVSSTQLVNDKKFTKELKKQHKIAGDDSSNRHSISPTLKKAPEHMLHGTTKQEEPNKETPIDLAPTASTSSSAMSSTYDRYKITTTTESTASLPSSTAAMAQTMDFETTSGVEVTLGKFEKADTKEQPRTPSDVSSSGAPVWTNVQLRSVRTGNSDDNIKSKTPNFAKVQLRKITPPTEAKQEQRRTNVLSITTTSKNESHPWESSADEASEVAETQVGDTKLEVVDPPHVLAPQNKVEPKQQFAKDSIKQPTKQSEKKKIDEAVVVNLKLSSTADKAEQDKVIIGRVNIMVVKTKADEKQADVLWKMSRTDAVSLNIDMARLIVKLIAVDGSILREMSFDATEDCLKFANAFYEKLANESTLKESKIVEEKPKVEIPQPVVEAADDDGDTEFAAVRLERLNDEEQAVLDTYRRLRRSKPPKDALEESVSKESASTAPTINTAKVLSKDDEAVATKYRKMLKMKVPIEAVQHSMQNDGVNEQIIAAILTEISGVPTDVQTDTMPSSPVSTFSCTTALSETDVAIVERFKKMLKMRIPEDAVKHKLMKEGIDTKLHEFIFESKGNGDNQKSLANALKPADEEVAAHYRKLIARGVPKESVRHGMAKDNVASHIVTAVLGESKEQARSSAPPLPKKDVKDDLSPEEKRIASEFKKLLKRQIPRQQILDRMKKEGVSENVMVAVLGKRGLSVQTKDDVSQLKGNSSRFVQIHWTPLAGSQLENSVWNTTKSKGKSNEVAAPEGTAFSKLKELFEKKTNDNKPKDKSVNKSSDAPSKAKLLDINRSNNVAIGLKAFKSFTYSELADIIKFLDPLRKLQGERVHFLRDLLPTISETKLVEAYDGPESRLEPAEIWFKSIVGIKRIETKVQVLRTMEMLEVESRSIGENLRLLKTVCYQVMDSEKLQDLLVMVLQIGNIMNEGTRTGGAAGFKLDSLLKLTQTKSADGKTTVLDYLVEDVFIAKGERHKLELSCDFPDCSTAGRMLIGDLVAEVKAMQDSVTQCKDELETLKKEANSNSGGVKSAIANIESQEKNSIYGAIQRLDAFVVSAENIVKSLVKDKDDALTASRELCMYCGEGSGTAAATSLLGILSEFATNIEAAVKKSDEKRKARERRQKRQAADEQSVKTIESKQDGDGNAESLVVLVNKMLKDANPRLVEDFKKGRKLENPSQLLKTIYQKEQIREGQRASLVTAIQEKVEDLNENDIWTARTKFGSPRAHIATNEGNTFIGDSTPARDNTQARPPPLPWSPPVHRDTSKERSPLGSTVVSDASETVSYVTETSTAMTSLTDEPLENFEPHNKRPVTRPTPEGMPLRDKSTPANVVSSSIRDVAESSSKRDLTTQPNPETGFREIGAEKHAPIPETETRRTQKRTSVVKTVPRLAESDTNSSETSDIVDDILVADNSQYTDNATSFPDSSGALKTDHDMKTANIDDIAVPLVPDTERIYVRSNFNLAEESSSTIRKNMQDEDSAEEPKMEEVTCAASGTGSTTTPALSCPIEEAHDPIDTKKENLGRVSALTAAFSKSSSCALLPSHQYLPTSTTSLELGPKALDTAQSIPAERASEDVPTNSVVEQTMTDLSTTMNAMDSTAIPLSSFQHIRDQLKEKRNSSNTPGMRPDPPSESEPSSPTPGNESIQETDRTIILGSEETIKMESPASSSQSMKENNTSVGHNSSPAIPEDLHTCSTQNNTTKEKTSPRFSFLSRPWKNRNSLGKRSPTRPGETANDVAAISIESPDSAAAALQKSPEEPHLTVEDVGRDSRTTTETSRISTEDNSVHTLFDIAAAKGRLSSRKSIEENPSYNPNSNSSFPPPNTPAVVSSPKKPAKSLQEQAKMKREMRSMDKSPMKKPIDTAGVPSISGYLELARQRRDGNRRSDISNKASPPASQEANKKIPPKPPSSLEKKESLKGESLFARLAREKRAAKKGITY